MSTSDQRGPLTRKQLREIRLTGSTPVISEEEAAAAAEATPPAPPAQSLPRAAEPAAVPPAPVADSAVDLGAAPLTRRQAREQEKIKTASVPVIGAQDDPQEETAEPAAPTQPASAEPESPAPAPVEAPAQDEIVSGVPDFSRTDSAADEDEDVDDEVAIEPVAAAGAVEAVGAVPLTEGERPSETAEDDDVATALGIPEPEHTDEDVLADPELADEDPVAEGERPTVSPAFGQGVLADEPHKPSAFRPSFDELLTSNDSGGSHRSPNALIFTPSPGEGSLSGPVASTGEILVTGSYELPKGIGSQGHAHGTADGKDVDAVLIDGELPPASSPTPIAASSAVSTIKPAGEVIRPPAPEKGNRLMMILAIVAGGLALALGVALVVAFSTNVF